MTTEQAKLLVNEWRRLASECDKSAKCFDELHPCVTYDIAKCAETHRAFAYRHCAHKLEEMLKQNP